jgi:hypothetical protein
MFAILRSVTDKQVRLISQTGRLQEWPPEVCQRGPWKIERKGDEARLRLHYRRALAREGYCVVGAEAPLFTPDEPRQPT